MNSSLIISVISISVAFVSVLISFGVLVATMRYTSLAKKDLTFTAYAQAVQAILTLKRTFAEKPGTFEAEINKNPTLGSFKPKNMNVSDFLMFTSGFWQFSYVHSVMRRWKELGLTKNERDGLEKEMLIWLHEVPGFREVYDTLIRHGYNHNADFLEYLAQVAYPACQTTTSIQEKDAAATAV
ncbi:MAG: hypothetical protein ACJ788_14215 [Ktedonobacteraceae bacterium]